VRISRMHEGLEIYVEMRSCEEHEGGSLGNGRGEAALNSTRIMAARLLKKHFGSPNKRGGVRNMTVRKLKS
jgi:hypothetical protein